MTYRTLPIDEMASMRARGLSWQAIGAHFRISAPTVRRHVAGVIPSQQPRALPPSLPERAFAELMARTRHRFNDALTDADARALRELTGWQPLMPDEGDHD